MLKAQFQPSEQEKRWGAEGREETLKGALFQPDQLCTRETTCVCGPFVLPPELLKIHKKRNAV